MRRLYLENQMKEREENVGQIITLKDFDRQETAYDVDKIVERLEDMRNDFYIKEKEN